MEPAHRLLRSQGNAELVDEETPAPGIQATLLQSELLSARNALKDAHQQVGEVQALLSLLSGPDPYGDPASDPDGHAELAEARCNLREASQQVKDTHAQLLALERIVLAPEQRELEVCRFLRLAKEEAEGRANALAKQLAELSTQEHLQVRPRVAQFEGIVRRCSTVLEAECEDDTISTATQTEATEQTSLAVQGLHEASKLVKGAQAQCLLLEQLMLMYEQDKGSQEEACHLLRLAKDEAEAHANALATQLADQVAKNDELFAMLATKRTGDLEDGEVDSLDGDHVEPIERSKRSLDDSVLSMQSTCPLRDSVDWGSGLDSIIQFLDTVSDSESPVRRRSIDAWQQQVAVLEEQARASTKALAKAEAEASQCQHLREQIRVLTVEKSLLEGKLVKANAQLKVAGLEDEVSTLHTMLADANADAQKRLEQHQAQNAGLQREVETLLAEKSNAKLKVAGLEKEVMILEKQVAHEKAVAGERLEQLEAQFADAERARKEHEAREAEALLQVRMAAHLRLHCIHYSIRACALLGQAATLENEVSKLASRLQLQSAERGAWAADVSAAQELAELRCTNAELNVQLVELERASQETSFSTIAKNPVQTNQYAITNTKADAKTPVVEARILAVEVQKDIAQLRPYVGLEICKERTPDKGLRILTVKPNGPAAAAGLVADEYLHSIHDGDRWVSLTKSIFDEKLKSMLPGDAIKAKVYAVPSNTNSTATTQSLQRPSV